MSVQSNASFKEIGDRVQKHVEERDWDNNPPRGLAISIALEANELLEHYQWQDESVGTADELAEELADVFIYAFQFAEVYKIDIADAIEKKLAKAAIKYPAENFKAKTGSERKKAWLEAKLNHHKEGL